jgi:hypothetical protein
MYDKYNSLTPLPAAGTKLPKHKGILISAQDASTVRFQYMNASGTTFTTGITFSSGSSVLPIEIYALNTSLPTGVTGFYLN